MRVLLITFVVALGACRGASEPGDPPILSGTIVATGSMSTGAIPTIHVKSEVAEQCGIIFAVQDAVPVARRLANGSVQAATRDELTIGQQVRVWASHVFESCPGQSAAERIELY